jgi:hypothetical protein
MALIQNCVVRGAALYVVSFATAVENVDQRQRTFDAIADSFRFS